MMMSNNDVSLASILRTKFNKACNGEDWHDESNILIPTGFTELDKALGGGLPNSGLSVIGAEPSFGKTTLSLQMLEQMCKLSGRPGLVVSLEMSANDLADKALVRDIFKHNMDDPDCCFCVSQMDNRDFVLTETQLVAYGDALGRIESNLSKIKVIDGSDQMSIVDRLENSIKDCINTYGTAPIIVIDYLQLIKTSNATDKRLDIDETIVRIKRLCKVYSVIVLLISSIGRAFYGKKLARDAFKESGGIEFSADVLLGLQYQHLDDAKAPKSVREMEVAILKNRKCEQVIINFRYFAKYDFFQEQTHHKWDVQSAYSDMPTF